MTSRFTKLLNGHARTKFYDQRTRFNVKLLKKAAAKLQQFNDVEAQRLAKKILSEIDDELFYQKIKMMQSRLGGLCGMRYRTDDEEQEMQELIKALHKADADPGWPIEPRIIRSDPLVTISTASKP